VTGQDPSAADMPDSDPLSELTTAVENLASWAVMFAEAHEHWEATGEDEPSLSDQLGVQGRRTLANADPNVLRGDVRVKEDPRETQAWYVDGFRRAADALNTIADVIEDEPFDAPGKGGAGESAL
jgi:hypothetical protein